MLNIAIFFLLFFYWSITALQPYVSFCCTMKYISYLLCLAAQSCPTLGDPMNCSPPGSSILGDSLGNNTGVGCHALLQGIFPTQGLNPGLPHCRWILYLRAAREYVCVYPIPLGLPSSHRSGSSHSTKLSFLGLHQLLVGCLLTQSG